MLNTYSGLFWTRVFCCSRIQAVFCCVNGQMQTAGLTFRVYRHGAKLMSTHKSGTTLNVCHRHIADEPNVFGHRILNAIFLLTGKRRPGCQFLFRKHLRKTSGQEHAGLSINPLSSLSRSTSAACAPLNWRSHLVVSSTSGRIKALRRHPG
jgi:hypothetical protein